MPDTPERVYRDAAGAMVEAQGYELGRFTMYALTAGWERNAAFRVAVDVAYAAGRKSIADRLVWLDDTTATVDRSVVNA
jgi:hypothetical protein